MKHSRRRDPPMASDRHRGRRKLLWVSEDQARDIDEIVHELNAHTDEPFTFSDFAREAFDRYVRELRGSPVFDRRVKAEAVTLERRRARARRTYANAPLSIRDIVDAIVRQRLARLAARSSRSQPNASKSSRPRTRARSKE